MAEERKQVTLRIVTTNLLDEYKLIPKESYDSIITRLLESIEENNTRG